MGNGIVNTAFASGPKEKADAIENVTPMEVAAAAADVVRAAVEARQEEFVQDPSSSVDPETGEPRYNYQDYATGDMWIQTSSNQWMNTSTQQTIDHDPREVDPAQYQWVLDKFEYFYDRWASFPEAMGDHCEAAKRAIESGQMAAFGSVKDIVTNGWGGDAQVAFTDFFLEPFANAITNQQQMLDELAVAMYAYTALLKQAKIDAKMAADSAVKVLDGLNDRNPPDAKTIIAVVGVVVSVVATVSTAGSAAPLAFGLISAGISGAGIVAGELQRQQEKDLSGGTVDEVLDKLSTALDQLKSDMDGVEENLAGPVSEAASRVSELIGSDDPYDKATILPNEPNDDVTDVTGGHVPDHTEFRPRR